MAHELLRDDRVIALDTADLERVHVEDFGPTGELALVLPQGTLAVELLGDDLLHLAAWIIRRFSEESS